MSRRRMTIPEFFKEIRYKGPWELGTMLWCFCGNSAFDRVRSKTLAKDQRALRKMRIVMKRRLGQNPNPGKLISKFYGPKE